MKLLLILVMALFVTGCTQPDKAHNILIADGVSNVEMTGYSFFGCSDKDTYSDGFRGVKNGKHVEGVVCAGVLFKGETIRYTSVSE